MNFANAISSSLLLSSRGGSAGGGGGGGCCTGVSRGGGASCNGTMGSADTRVGASGECKYMPSSVWVPSFGEIADGGTLASGSSSPSCSVPLPLPRFSASWLMPSYAPTCVSKSSFIMRLTETLGLIADDGADGGGMCPETSGSKVDDHAATCVGSSGATCVGARPSSPASPRHLPPASARPAPEVDGGKSEESSGANVGAKAGARGPPAKACMGW